MNINVALGILSFVVWSIFSSWFYVNYIRVFDPNVENELISISAMRQNTADSVATKRISEQMINETPSPIYISRSFTFHKNTTDLINPMLIGQFTDSLVSTLNDRTFIVIITGATCDLGKEIHNYNLGLDRANHIVNALEASDITWPEMTIKSQGESNPIVPNTSEKSRIKNRRVNVLITSKS